jgi:aspartate kinase
MAVKVCKFGGTSLADADQVRKVGDIVRSDPQRRFIVPSAPGKRTPQDQKITDLLYLCHAHAQQGIAFDEVFGIVAQRYRQIVADLGLKLDLGPKLDEVKAELARVATADGPADYAASRGEYLNGLVIAEFLDAEFVDAAEVIFFNAKSQLDMPRSADALAQRLYSFERAVIPGFYGSAADGSVKTFSRGGSDISGAVVAAGVAASVYENWTDVSGLLMADPRVVPNPRTIDAITYQELRELSYMGATVLHEDAIFPVRNLGIPVNIRNTNRPADPGTMIVSDAGPVAHSRTITGIAGRKDFTIIALSKALMNAQIGFGRRVLSVLEANGISFEHMPSSIDTMSVVVADAQLTGKLDKVLHEVQVEVEPDTLEVNAGMALIATVGRGMAQTPGMAAKVFNALGEAGVNIRMIDQGSSELNIIVGVQAADFENAVRAIYNAFVN